MKARVATLTILALIAVAGSSSSAPPDRPPPPDRRVEPKPPACTGWPCQVTPYQGALPGHHEIARMTKLGCEPPFNHVGGIKDGQTAWVGFSCPASINQHFKHLPADFSDACLPKRHGRVYVAVMEATCRMEPWPYEMPFSDQVKKLGCGPLLKYSSGASNGIIGGIGAYCPDTRAVREATPRRLGYPPGYCDGCMKVPAGQIFLYWQTEIGPNCPGGCPHGTGPTEL